MKQVITWCSAASHLSHVWNWRLFVFIFSFLSSFLFVFFWEQNIFLFMKNNKNAVFQFENFEWFLLLLSYFVYPSVIFFFIDLLAIKFRNRYLYFKLKTLKTLLTFVLSKYELFPSTLNNNNIIIVIMGRIERVCFSFLKIWNWTNCGR